MITKTVRAGGLASAGLVLALAFGSQRSYAQTYGAVAAATQADGSETIEGNPAGLFYGSGTLAGLDSLSDATAGPGPGSGSSAAEADLVTGVDADASAITTEGGGSSVASVYDTITTGATGGTMSLDASGNYFVTLGAPGSVEQVDHLDLVVVNQTSGGVLFGDGQASEVIQTFFGSFLATSQNSTVTYDNGNGPPLPQIPDWETTISATWDATPDTTYIVRMDADCTEQLNSLTVGGPAVTSYDSIDPTWSFSTSPGVTYTAGFALPTGPTIPYQAVAAPEPSSCALLLPVGGFPLLVRRRVQVRRYALRV